MTKAIISGSTVAYLLPNNAAVDFATGIVSIGGEPAFTAGDIQNGSLPNPALKSGITLFDTGAPAHVLAWDGAGVVAGPDYAGAFAQAQAALLAQVNTQFNAIITAGFPTGGLHVQIDDGSRANLGGMATTAGFVIAGVAGLTWPPSYAKGWISMEGALIPLPTPADGIALANAAGIYYSEAAQNEADLLAAIAEADSFAALQAIDVTAGWPS